MTGWVTVIVSIIPLRYGPHFLPKRKSPLKSTTKNSWQDRIEKIWNTSHLQKNHNLKSESPQASFPLLDIYHDKESRAVLYFSAACPFGCLNDEIHSILHGSSWLFSNQIWSNLLSMSWEWEKMKMRKRTVLHMPAFWRGFCWSWGSLSLNLIGFYQFFCCCVWIY